jgi:glycosyltransferase involved in cell wall biosynthesis
MPPKISVLLPVFNNAATIRATLEAIRWADEILVVDSFSTDNTLDICREYGARIIQHEYINSAKQKNWAVPQCSHEWILQMDTDETLEKGCESEIRNVIQNAPPDIHAFSIPFKHHVLGKWARYGGLYPSYITRLFRREHGRWEEREVHARVQVDGKIEKLQKHILHQGMPYITNQIRNLDRYTRYEADELKKQGKKFSAYRLLIHPWFLFGYRYFWLQGWRDGWRGLIICAYLGAYSFFMYAKLWEMEELGLEKSPK